MDSVNGVNGAVSNASAETKKSSSEGYKAFTSDGKDYWAMGRRVADLLIGATTPAQAQEAVNLLLSLPDDVAMNHFAMSYKGSYDDSLVGERLLSQISNEWNISAEQKQKVLTHLMNNAIKFSQHNNEDLGNEPSSKTVEARKVLQDALKNLDKADMEKVSEAFDFLLGDGTTFKVKG